MASSTTQLTQLSDDILTSHCRLAQNLTAENLDEILTYVVNRLLKDYPLLKSTDNVTLSNSTTNNGLVDNQQPTGIIANTVSSNTNTATSPVVPAIHLKVFYQVTATPSIDLMLTALNDFRQKCQEKASIAFTVLPACSLHNFSTFLSICGVRHE